MKEDVRHNASCLPLSVCSAAPFRFALMRSFLLLQGASQ
jgi:hypothetical protein